MQAGLREEIRESKKKKIGEIDRILRINEYGRIKDMKTIIQKLYLPLDRINDVEGKIPNCSAIGVLLSTILGGKFQIVRQSGLLFT